jgi:hypothetical protein
MSKLDYFISWRLLTFLRSGAQPEIKNYSHACHKVFKSRDEADGFIKEYQMTAELVASHHRDEDNARRLDILMSQLRVE